MDPKAQKKIVSEAIFALFENQLETDIKFVLWKEVIRAHKIVLISGSDYFARTLTSTELKIDEPAELFREVLRALYGQAPTRPWTHELVKIFVKYELKAFCLPTALKTLEVKPGTFSDYLLYLNRLHPSGIPPGTRQECALLLKPDYEYEELSKLSDDLIVEFMSSPYYRPKNIYQTLLLLKKLVRDGHDKRLYDLIDYDQMPEKYRKEIPKGAKNGPIPRSGLVILEEPVLVEYDLGTYNRYVYKTRVTSYGSQRAIIKGKNSLVTGDILRGDGRMFTPEFASEAYYDSDPYYLIWSS